MRKALNRISTIMQQIFQEETQKTKIRKTVVTYKRKSSALAQSAAEPWTLEGSEQGRPNDEETFST